MAARVLDTELTRDGVKDVFLRKVRGTAADELSLGAMEPLERLALQASLLLSAMPSTLASRCRDATAACAT